MKIKFYITGTVDKNRRNIIEHNGGHVYDLRDCSGTDYLITNGRVLCNNIGSMITDVAIPFEDKQFDIYDSEFHDTFETSPMSEEEYNALLTV